MLVPAMKIGLHLPVSGVDKMNGAGWRVLMTQFVSFGFYIKSFYFHQIKEEFFFFLLLFTSFAQRFLC